jgi:3-oxoacyl-[acyl-carrier protein] reductase
MINLINRVALVTGGSRGVGAATAQALAEAGANVAITYHRNLRSAEKVVGEIQRMGREGLAIRCRVDQYVDCRRAVSAVVARFGRIDILINNAGIWEFGEIGRMRPSQWMRTISVNLTSVFNLCNLVVPIMRKQRYGRIINVSSTAGQRGEAFHSHYAASKGGINAFTKSLATELIEHGIWVNAIAPGWIDTDMTAGVLRNSNQRKQILQAIPRKKAATPDEIAGPILFLASELSNNIVGEILNANGGSVLCG